MVEIPVQPESKNEESRLYEFQSNQSVNKTGVPAQGAQSDQLSLVLFRSSVHQVRLTLLSSPQPILTSGKPMQTLTHLGKLLTKYPGILKMTDIPLQGDPFRSSRTPSENQVVIKRNIEKKKQYSCLIRHIFCRFLKPFEQDTKAPMQ